MVGLSAGERHFLQGGIAQDLRPDGRKRLYYQPVYVETGVIPQANGSAILKLGATDVIATVKAEIGKPHPMQPDKGKFQYMLIVVLLQLQSLRLLQLIQGRGGEELSVELSVSLQRCLLGGKSGSVAEGKVCWDLYIDCLVFSFERKLLDALGAAIMAALSNTGIPRVHITTDGSGEETALS